MMDPGTEASRRAVAAERVRSARFVSVFSFIGISIAFALNLLVPYASPAQKAFQTAHPRCPPNMTAIGLVFLNGSSLRREKVASRSAQRPAEYGLAGVARMSRRRRGASRRR
jgi:hypothetical protein